MFKAISASACTSCLGTSCRLSPKPYMTQLRNCLTETAYLRERRVLCRPERICDERAQAGKSCELMVQRDVHGQGGNCYLTLDVRALVASWCRVRQGG